MANQGPNRKAAEKTIKALRDAGVLEHVDEIRVVAVQSLATACDAQPDNASLWREYRAAEAALRETTHGDTDEFAVLLADLSAEVGDQTNRRSK